MVSPALLCAVLLCGQTPDVVGVVRAPSGPVNVSGNDAAVGALIADGATIETGEGAWLELVVFSEHRIRLSEKTKIVLRVAESRPKIELSSGRIWIQSKGNLSVGTSHLDVELLVSSSTIIDHATITGTFVVTRSGVARVTRRGGRVTLLGGEAVMSGPELEGPLEKKPGGHAMAELVAKETREGLGDLVGLSSYLAQWAQQVDISDLDLRGVRQVAPSDTELQRGDFESEGVERALRPAPFFESEALR